MTTISDRAGSPETPHDPTYSFDQPGYFEPATLRRNMLCRMIHQELDQRGPDVTVLDIGCGRGIGRKLEPVEAIKQRVAKLWGVEPDKSVEPPACFDQVWQETLEDADIPDHSVDVAYSYFVIEHVVDPVGFAKKLARILKPGGVCISATVNRNCFFAQVSWLCHKLSIQDAVLTVLIGKPLVEEYHYPAVYQMNTRASLQALAHETGISRVDVTYLESDEWLNYFPRPFRWCGHIARRLFNHRPQNYSYLYARLTA